MKTIALLSLTALLLGSCIPFENEDWKRRWNEDTKALTDELRLAAQKIADLSTANSRLEAENAALKSEIMALRKAAGGA